MCSQCRSAAVSVHTRMSGLIDHVWPPTTHPPSGRALALGPLTREPAAARGEPTRPCGRPSRARHEAAPARERSRAHSTRGADTHTTPESSTRDGISLTFVAEHIARAPRMCTSCAHRTCIPHVHRRCTQHVLHMSHCTCTSCAHRTCTSCAQRTCTSCAHRTCIPHVHQRCTQHVHHMSTSHVHLLCTSHVHLMCTSHVHLMRTPHVHLMCT